MSLEPIDGIVFFAYFFIVIGIALWVSRKPKDHERTSEDFFLAGRALPWWIIGTSLIASNISAEQMIGMTGSAFASGIAIVSYEWMAAITLLIVAKFFMPVFLELKIYSMPQYLERRFDYRVSVGLAIFWLLVYVFVNLTSVMYLGALTLQTIMEPAQIPLIWGVIALAVVSAIYTIYGGLSAVAWTDIIQVTVLFVGGTAVTLFGLNAVSGDEGGIVLGFTQLLNEAPDKFHTILDWNHETLPWIGVFFGGMWAANLSYWGFNQYITQRALAGKNIREAQYGLVFAAFLKVIVPIVVVWPGILAFSLYSNMIERPDMAYPTLIRELVPAGFTGLIIAAIIAAIVSSLNSMTNSSATIFTMDIFKRMVPDASERTLVLVGRITTAAVLIIAVCVAPLLANLDEAFQYIQEYTGMISPGIVAIFLFGIFWKRCTSNAAVWMAILTIPISAGLKFLPRLLDLILGELNVISQFLDPFLNRMGVSMVLILLIGYIITLMTKEEAPKEEYDVSGVTFKTPMMFNLFSILVIGVLAALYILFW